NQKEAIGEKRPGSFCERRCRTATLSTGAGLSRGSIVVSVVHGRCGLAYRSHAEKNGQPQPVRPRDRVGDLVRLVSDGSLRGAPRSPKAGALRGALARTNLLSGAPEVPPSCSGQPRRHPPAAFRLRQGLPPRGSDGERPLFRLDRLPALRDAPSRGIGASG